MGEIRDIVDSLQELGKQASDVQKDLFTVRRSISSKAMDGTCYFPVIVDNSIALDDAMTIARALERKYASFMLTVLTMDPYFNTDGVDVNATDYIAKFHKNMRVNQMLPRQRMKLGDMEELLKENYSFMEESVMDMAACVYQGIKSQLAERQVAKWNYTLEDVANPAILNDMGARRRNVMEEVQDNSPDGRIERARTKGIHISGDWVDNHTYVDAKSTHNHTISPTINNNVPITNNIQMPKQKTVRTPMQRHIVDGEFKKANDLVPTMLHIRVYPKSDKEGVELPEPIDFVLGIKVTLHPVAPDVVAEQLAKGVNADDAFFNFIKWTTGETKFFKDFVFAVDRQKADAMDMRSNAKGWFVASKRRKVYSNMMSKFTKKNIPTPIMSIIVTTDTLYQLKELYGYDVEKNPGLIKRFMDEYFLLGFVTVNPGTQRVDFQFDGNEQTETVTLNTLIREETRDDKKFKDMMKMIGRSM